MSRSLTMPCTVSPSSLTTTAPIRCSESSPSSSVTEASVRTVMTSPPLRLTTSEILMHRRYGRAARRARGGRRGCPIERQPPHLTPSKSYATTTTKR